MSPSPTLSFCFDRISQLLSVVAVVSYSTPICDTRASLCQVTRGCITIVVLEALYSRDWKLGPLLLPPPQAWFSRRSGAYGLQNLSTVGKPVHTNEVKKKQERKREKRRRTYGGTISPFFFPAVLVHRMRSLKVAANWMDKQRASHHGKESWTFHNMGRSVVNMKTRKKNNRKSASRKQAKHIIYPTQRIVRRNWLMVEQGHLHPCSLHVNDPYNDKLTIFAVQLGLLCFLRLPDVAAQVRL